MVITYFYSEYYDKFDFETIKSLDLNKIAQRIEKFNWSMKYFRI